MTLAIGSSEGRDENRDDSMQMELPRTLTRLAFLFPSLGLTKAPPVP